MTSATRSGASRYGAPGGRSDGGPARAQYLEPDATVSPQILADGQHPYAMDELEQAITDIDIVGFTLLKNVLSGEECEELLAIHREVADAYGTPSGTAEDGESWHVANLPTLHPSSMVLGAVAYPRLLAKVAALVASLPNANTFHRPVTTAVVTPMAAELNDGEV